MKWREEYRFERTENTRFFGWPMTKSIVGLLVGIAVEQGGIFSIEDRVNKYIPRLVGHPFGEMAFRNFLRIINGICICGSFYVPSNFFERHG